MSFVCITKRLWTIFLNYFIHFQIWNFNTFFKFKNWKFEFELFPFLFPKSLIVTKAWSFFQFKKRTEEVLQQGWGPHPLVCITLGITPKVGPTWWWTSSSFLFDFLLWLGFLSLQFSSWPAPCLGPFLYFLQKKLIKLKIITSCRKFSFNMIGAHCQNFFSFIINAHLLSTRKENPKFTTAYEEATVKLQGFAWILAFRFRYALQLVKF